MVNLCRLTWVLAECGTAEQMLSRRQPSGPLCPPSTHQTGTDSIRLRHVPWVFRLEPASCGFFVVPDRLSMAWPSFSLSAGLPNSAHLRPELSQPSAAVKAKTQHCPSVSWSAWTACQLQRASELHHVQVGDYCMCHPSIQSLHPASQHHVHKEHVQDVGECPAALSSLSSLG